MLRRIVPSRKSLRTFAVAGAWFFIVVSLAHLLWAVGHKWSDPAGTYKMYHAVVGDRSYDAWGLTYSGTLGLIMVLSQALLVAAAAAASVLPWPRSLKLRRIAHGVLCAWATLWALDLVWLASIDHQLDSTAQAALLCLLLGCTGYRATMGWSPGRSTTPPDAAVGGMHSESAVGGMHSESAVGGMHSESAAGGRVVHGIRTHDYAVRATQPLRRQAVASVTAFVSATRHKTAAGLDRIGDFVHKQAQRIAIR